MYAKYFIILFLGLFPTLIQAQEVVLHNGKVLANNEVYCLYKESYAPVDPQIPLSDIAGGEWQTSPFSDYTFGTSSGSHLIKAIAKKLAMPRKAFLYYYYNITLPDGKQINIEHRPYIMEYFAKDLVKYDVYKDGWNDEGAEKLYDLWAKKMGNIPQDAISQGSVADYNHHPHFVYNNDITVKEGKVYLYDSLIATYRATDRILTKTRYANNFRKDTAAYVISNLQQHALAVLFLTNRLRGQAYMTVGDNDEAHTLTTADMSESNLVISAIRYLLWRKML